MDRHLTSGPIVWLGIITVTCLLLLVFQTILWLVLPVLFAVIFYYILSPLVSFGVSHGLTRARAVMVITVLLTLFLVAGGALLEPKVSMAVRGLRNGEAETYLSEGNDMLKSAQATLYEYFPFLRSSAPEAPVAPQGPLGVVTLTADVHPSAPPLTATAGDAAKSSVTPAMPARAASPRGSAGSKSATSDVAHSASDAALKTKIADWTGRYSGGIALELLHWIPSVLLIPYLTYFFLLDGPRFKRFLVQAIPNAYFEKTLFLFYRVENQLRAYFRGVLLLTLLDAFCLGVGLWFLGLDAPFFLAGIAAVIAWLPYLGSIGGCLMVVLVAHHDMPLNPWLPYEAIALFAVVRLCDDFIFLPLTIGRSLRMHPLITVLMILLGGAVAGISGLLLVMPVLGVVMVAGQIIGELLTDHRIQARHRHVKHLRRIRAQIDL